MASRLVVALGLAGALALLPGCLFGRSKQTRIDLPTEPQTYSNVGLTAEIEGDLVFDEETDCVLLRTPDRTNLVVWPTGTTAYKNPFELRLPAGFVAHQGDRIEGGGGYFGRSVLEELAKERHSRTAIPSPACPHQDDIAALNANDIVGVIEQER